MPFASASYHKEPSVLLYKILSVLSPDGVAPAAIAALESVAHIEQIKDLGKLLEAL